MGEDILQNIKEMILDERKLVTYVSVSKELCIHVNESKSLLHKIVADIKSSKLDSDLNVNYIISGLADNNKAFTRVCSEKEMITLKESSKMVFFVHIYSVNKGLSSKDNVSLMAVNKFDDFTLCSGLIKSRHCVKRSSEELSNLHCNQEPISDEQKSAQPVKNIKPERTAIKATPKSYSDKSIVKPHESKSEPNIKTELPSPKKDIISNSKQNASKNNNSNKNQKGIAGFFTRSNTEPGKVTNNLQRKSNVVKKEITEVKVEKMDIDSPLVEKDTDKDNINVNEVKSKKSDNRKDKFKTNKTLNPKRGTKVESKRKRVLHISDSESDDNADPFVDEPLVETDDEIPATPSVNTIKITSGIVNPKKRRKVVDKTYTDEDGYILTKKEEVYESCSEEEVDTKENVKNVNQVKLQDSPTEKKNDVKSSKKKVSPPQQKKQCTLLNFFKKA